MSIIFRLYKKKTKNLFKNSPCMLHAYGHDVFFTTHGKPPVVAPAINHTLHICHGYTLN